MKTLKFLATMMMVLFLADFYAAGNEQTSVRGDGNSTITVISQPELNNLAMAWASGFEKTTGTKVTLVPQISTDLRPAENTIYLVDENSPLLQNGTGWKMLAAHDVVVAIVNSSNHKMDLLLKQGLASTGFSMLLKQKVTWNQIVKGAPENNIKCYISNAAGVPGKLAEFTGNTIENIPAETILPVNEVIEKVQKDANAIGFCKLSDVVKQGENSFIQGIALVPVDKNKNGTLDQFENIGQNPASFSRGVWIGKYPRELSGDIFLFATSRPEGKANLGFLSYVINNGQSRFNDAGFAVLSGSEKTMARSAFAISAENITAKKAETFISKGLFVALIFTLAAIALIVYLFVKRRNLVEISGEDLDIAPVLSGNMIRSPKGLYYGKSHTWAFMEQDGMVHVGVDDFIKRVTGTVTQIKLREPGERIRKGEKLFTLVHEGKQLDIYSPVSGFIKEQNPVLLKSPSKLSIAPFSEGWIYRIEPSNWLRDTGFMFMFEKYREWIDDEFIRLKDFLANTANNHQAVYQHIVLQDGGELKDEVLAGLDPEIWEEFQTRFIDVSK